MDRQDIDDVVSQYGVASSDRPKLVDALRTAIEKYWDSRIEKEIQQRYAAELDKVADKKFKKGEPVKALCGQTGQWRSGTINRMYWEVTYDKTTDGSLGDYQTVGHVEPHRIKKITKEDIVAVIDGETRIISEHQKDLINKLLDKANDERIDTES